MGLPPKVEACSPRLERRGDHGPRDHHPGRQAAGQRLGAGQDIGDHALVLIPEPSARSPHAGLDLVQDQQHTATVTQLAESGQVIRIGDVDAPFTLDRLDQDGGRLVVEHLGDSPEVVVRHVHEARDHRLEPGVVLGLSRGRQCGVGPAVESALHRHDLEPASFVAENPCQLDGGLVGFRAAVAEEALAAEGPLRKRLGQLPLGLHVPGVGHVDQAADLLADRLDDPGRAVAQQVASPARKEVEVPVPFGVPDPRSLTAHEADGEAPVIGDHIPLELSDGFLGTRVGGRRQGRVSSFSSQCSVFSVQLINRVSAES